MGWKRPGASVGFAECADIKWKAHPCTKAEKEMKELTHQNLSLARTIVLASILLAVSGIIDLPGQNRIGFGLTHGDQDSAPPPSPPFANLTPDNLDFGNQVVRRTSAVKRITIQNTGGKSLYIESVTVGGDNPNSFVIASDTCTGATVEANKACVVGVTFTPTGTGGRNARLRFKDNALDSPQRLKLKGNGINSNDVPPF